MEKPILKNILISSCETHHIYKDFPLYPLRFDKVLKFHAPGLAPAINNTGAFHINLKGEPAYTPRFKQTFGFYDFLAAVETKLGWGHITIEGKLVYDEIYSWVGNYQENISVVRDFDGKYFHINLQGESFYSQKYNYAGDFKDGIAVVCTEDGKCTHIDNKGMFIHNYFYNQLDIFHKGYARAKDEEGWFHVTKDGIPAYNIRYTSVEPFYNGRAHAQANDGTLMIINEKGEILYELVQAKK